MRKNRLFAVLLAAVWVLAACAGNDLVIDTGETAAPVSVGTVAVRETEPPAETETATETETQTAEAVQETTAVPPESESETAETTAQTGYILNVNSKKIHLPTCGSVKTMKETNKKETNETLEELYAQGYTDCGNCKPSKAK